MRFTRSHWIKLWKQISKWSHAFVSWTWREQIPSAELTPKTKGWTKLFKSKLVSLTWVRDPFSSTLYCRHCWFYYHLFYFHHRQCQQFLHLSLPHRASDESFGEGKFEVIRALPSVDVDILADGCARRERLHLLHGLRLLRRMSRKLHWENLGCKCSSDGKTILWGLHATPQLHQLKRSAEFCNHACQLPLTCNTFQFFFLL